MAEKTEAEEICDAFDELTGFVAYLQKTVQGFNKKNEEYVSQYTVLEGGVNSIENVLESTLQWIQQNPDPTEEVIEVGLQLIEVAVHLMGNMVVYHFVKKILSNPESATVFASNMYIGKSLSFAELRMERIEMQAGESEQLLKRMKEYKMNNNEENLMKTMKTFEHILQDIKSDIDVCKWKLNDTACKIEKHVEQLNIHEPENRHLLVGIITFILLAVSITFAITNSFTAVIVICLGIVLGAWKWIQQIYLPENQNGRLQQLLEYKKQREELRTKYNETVRKLEPHCESATTWQHPNPLAFKYVSL